MDKLSFWYYFYNLFEHPFAKKIHLAFYLYIVLFIERSLFSR